MTLNQTADTVTAESTGDGAGLDVLSRQVRRQAAELDRLRGRLERLQRQIQEHRMRSAGER